MTDLAPKARPASYDKKVGLVLQGGGALGSYQAGVFEALATSDYVPDWVAGISIGAINAAIIAGNAPDERVPRLRHQTAEKYGSRWRPIIGRRSGRDALASRGRPRRARGPR